MKAKSLSLGLFAAAFLAALGAARAHHSFAAIWDASRELEVHGVLSKVQWMNPHSYFEVVVAGENGVEETYRFENFPPAILQRLGMSRRMMTDQIGQGVAVKYHPALDGTKTIGYGRVFTFDDGPTIVFSGKD